MIGPWRPAAPSTIERWACLFCGKTARTHGSRRGWAWRPRQGEHRRRTMGRTEHACPACVTKRGLLSALPSKLPVGHDSG